MDTSFCLGGKNGAGFGWQDMTVYKAGFEWQSSDDWTWRAGYSYGEQPIPSSEVVFNILAPGVMEDHFTVGFTRKVASGDEFNLAVMYAPKVKVSGPNMLDYPDPSFAQTITLDMKQWELEFSYSWK
jgi:long-chain fatty acid transport protein